MLKCQEVIVANINLNTFSTASIVDTFWSKLSSSSTAEENLLTGQGYIKNLSITAGTALFCGGHMIIVLILSIAFDRHVPFHFTMKKLMLFLL